MLLTSAGTLSRTLSSTFTSSVPSSASCVKPILSRIPTLYQHQNHPHHHHHRHRYHATPIRSFISKTFTTTSTFTSTSTSTSTTYILNKSSMPTSSIHHSIRTRSHTHIFSPISPILSTTSQMNTFSTNTNTNTPTSTSTSTSSSSSSSSSSPTATSTSASPPPTPPVPEKASKLSQLKKYGAVGVGTYLSIYVATLGGLYVIIHHKLLGSTVDVGAWLAALIEKMGLVEYFERHGYSPAHGGDFAAAWVATKFTEPIRLAVAIYITPKVARLLGRKVDDYKEKREERKQAHELEQKQKRDAAAATATTTTTTATKNNDQSTSTS